MSEPPVQPFGFGDTTFKAAGGEAGVTRLVEAFYSLMATDPRFDALHTLHPKPLQRSVDRLAAFLCGWMGGPPVYQAIKGTVCLTDPHEPYRIGPMERDQWLACMDEALARVDASDELKQMLKEPMFRIADTVRNCEDSTPKNQGPNIIAVS